MPETKPKFDRWMDMVTKVFTILIPVVLFYVGNEYNKSQDAKARQQQNFDRITTLLKSLSSENKQEKKLALKFAQGLAATGDFPMELLAVVNELSVTDSVNSRDAQDVLNTIKQKAITDNNRVVEKRVQQVVDSSDTRIYMQVPVGYNMKAARQLFANLKTDGFTLIGIERVDTNKAPKTTQVRYFLLTDSTIANSLAISLENQLNKPVKLNYIRGYENKIAGSQLEIWLK